MSDNAAVQARRSANRRHIAGLLKTAYAKALAEPVPPRFDDLLAQLASVDTPKPGEGHSG